MSRAGLAVILLACITSGQPPDSVQVVSVADAVFTAMKDSDGEAIAGHLSAGAVAEFEEILANLREYPDLTLAMLNFNWGVEVVDLNYTEWDLADLLRTIYSSPLSRNLLLDTSNRRTGITFAGDTAVVTWEVHGVEWPMVLVIEDGVWKVAGLEEF